MPDVAVLGLGLMGSAVANAFVEAGHDVTVWNRSPERSDAFRDRARVAASCRDAVVSSPVIITTMVDYAAAEEVLATVADLLVGRVVVNLISGTPQSARAMQTLVTAYGAAYLDAAIPGYPRDIGNEQFGVYVSGPAPLWERHRELLTSLGGANVHTGEDIGDAALTEMLIFAFYMPAMAAFLEAAALATSASVGASRRVGMKRVDQRCMGKTGTFRPRAVDCAGVGDEDFILNREDRREEDGAAKGAMMWVRGNCAAVCCI